MQHMILYVLFHTSPLYVIWSSYKIRWLLTAMVNFRSCGHTTAVSDWRRIMWAPLSLVVTASKSFLICIKIACQHVMFIYLWENLWNYIWNEENMPEPSILTDSCEITNHICLSALAIHHRTPLRIWRCTDHKQDTVVPLSGFYYVTHGKGAKEGLF